MGKTKRKSKSRDKTKAVVQSGSWVTLVLGLTVFLIFQIWVINLLTPKKPTFSSCPNFYKGQSETAFIEELALACFGAEPMTIKSGSVQNMEVVYAEKNNWWSPFVFTRERVDNQFFNFELLQTSKAISAFCQSILTLYKVKSFIPLEVFIVQNFQQSLKISMNKTDRECVTTILKRGEFRENTTSDYTKISFQLNPYTYSNRDDFVRFLDEILADYTVSFVPKSSHEDGSGRNKKTIIIPARIRLLSKDGLLDNPENPLWKNIIRQIAFINSTNEKLDIEFTSREMSYFANGFITEDQIPINFY
jgi:hypothetical protein